MHKYQRNITISEKMGGFKKFSFFLWSHSKMMPPVSNVSVFFIYYYLFYKNLKPPIF